ncbi:hypothetical protein [Pseudomonas luteola]|uniref:hypothetical protein n=1 Tax=Pseudomonas luteola TaxID=47886 RepID=UPI001E2AC9C4|nr:hypothetical protein [Pseudomonas luteola]
MVEEKRRTGDDARFNPVTTAKQVRFDISKATPKLLARSAAMFDMDEALIVIQSACGIETGDLAGLFFSGAQWSETTRPTWAAIVNSYCPAIKPRLPKRPGGFCC